MTMPKPLPEIEPCPFAHPVRKGPEMNRAFAAVRFVICRDCDTRGPWRKTERGAINAYNRRADNEK